MVVEDLNPKHMALSPETFNQLTPDMPMSSTLEP